MKTHYLDKLLYIIDNGLLDDLNDNNKQAADVRHNYFKIVLNRIYSKLEQVLFFPLRLMFKKRDKKIKFKNTWLIHETLNNYRALLPLKNNDSIFVKPNETILYRFLLFYRLLYTIPLIFWLLRKHKIRWFFVYLNVLGLIEESERLIKKYKPQKIVFANDINPYQVALKIAAKNKNVKTYYFQHACITKYMPPLDFDIAFLDGLDSYEKYKEIGEINSKVELIGMIKYRFNNFKPNANEKVKKIGFALNLLDNIDEVVRIMNTIIIKFPFIKIYLRKHPRDSRELLINNRQVTFSDSKNEDVFKFINNIDLLIAGESSIHLEASLLNVVSVYYNFASSNFFDVYKFIENGLVYHAKEENCLCNYIEKQIKKKSNVIERTKYYDEYMRTNVDYKDVLKKYGLIV